MYCIGTIKQLKYGYFGKHVVSITPRPCLFPSAAPIIMHAYISILCMTFSNNYTSSTTLKIYIRTS